MSDLTIKPYGFAVGSCTRAGAKGVGTGSVGVVFEGPGEGRGRGGRAWVVRMGSWAGG